MCRDKRQAFQMAEEEEGNDDGDEDDDGFLCAIINRLNDTPRLAMGVTAQETGQRATIMTLPDSGANICAAGLDIALKFGIKSADLWQTKLMSRTVDGSSMKSLGYFNATLDLNGIKVETKIYVFSGVSGLLISWKAAKQLHILPLHSLFNRYFSAFW